MDRRNPDPDPDDGMAPVEIPISDELDLHAFAPRDIRDAVEAYIEEAARRGIREVRLIHGKGKGVQRQSVQSLLAKLPDVGAYWDAPAHLGHFGATIARLIDRRGKCS